MKNVWYVLRYGTSRDEVTSNSEKNQAFSVSCYQVMFVWKHQSLGLVLSNQCCPTVICENWGWFDFVGHAYSLIIPAMNHYCGLWLCITMDYCYCKVHSLVLPQARLCLKIVPRQRRFGSIISQYINMIEFWCGYVSVLQFFIMLKRHAVL